MKRFHYINELKDFLDSNENIFDIDQDINKMFFDRFTCKIDEEFSPNSLFFFIDDVFYIKYYADCGYLWCSNKLIWQYILDNFESHNEYRTSYLLIKLFNRYMRKKFPEIKCDIYKIDPLKIYDELSLKIEEHFNKKCS